MTEERNTRRLEEFLKAYADGDTDRLGAMLADDAVWHVGGTHPFSGDYRGKDSILAYFDTVGDETGGTLRLDPIEMLANDRRGALFLRVTAMRGDRQLDVTMAEAFQFDQDGRIVEFWAHTTDQDAVNQFWREEISHG
ncbi:MAG TPA: nuclear transport factor 2 family protein [Acidimicrobiia bacterium]|nr:nuclear transport factor 2 family protein [Acidimicrobiia bacterium]